jgi:hypothetical protein
MDVRGEGVALYPRCREFFLPGIGAATLQNKATLIVMSATSANECPGSIRCEVVRLSPNEVK